MITIRKFTILFRSFILSYFRSTEANDKRLMYSVIVSLFFLFFLRFIFLKISDSHSQNTCYLLLIAPFPASLLPDQFRSSSHVGIVRFVFGPLENRKIVHSPQGIFFQLIFRWASRQFLTIPIVRTLVPVTFGYSLSSEVVVMRQLRR